MTDHFKEALKEIDHDKNYFEELSRILADKKNIRRDKKSIRR